MSTGANDPWGQWVTGCDSSQFEPQGHGWQDLHIITIHCYILVDIEAVSFMDSLRINLKKGFPHYKSLEANDPQGAANLDARGMAGTIYVGNH